MPRLNLKDEGTDFEGDPMSGKSSGPTPALREIGGGGGKLSPIVLILLILVVLAGGIYALNHFKVIRLWGKKAPVVTETLPEPEVATPSQAPAGGTTGNENLPLPSATTEQPAPSATPATREPAAQKQKARPAATSATTGSGMYTVQFAAWLSRAKADEQASLLSAAGFDAYVDESHAVGDRWYRVRVGRFDSHSQARDVIQKLQPMTEDVVWVARLRQK
jgi:hypothetical protein